MSDLFEEDRPGSNAPEYTVSEIAGTVRKLVETELGWVRVRGEVGRVTRPRSGHLYFDMKDDRSVLSCMTWKGQIAGLSIMPEEGMEVIAEGKMTASGYQSKFGLNVQTLAVAGEGALMAMLERRKRALAAEGLFAEERKRPLPYLPEVIGVVTSPSGAVIRDILHRLRDRFPRKVLIWPVAVQGEKCATEVARAIEGFNRLTPGGALPRPDLLIVARGGGSIEDLWGFNEEIVARAAAASEIPLISAVGHETDTTLIDFVADRRAPTPTAAAEMAVPVRLELAGWLREADARLTRGMRQMAERRRQRLTDLSRLLPSPTALLQDPTQRLDRVGERLSQSLTLLVERKRGRLGELAARVRPQTLLARFRVERTRLNERAAQVEPAWRRTKARKAERLVDWSARLAPALRRTLVRQEDDRRRLESLSARLEPVARARLRRLSDRLEALDRTRRSLGYEATLARGYAVVRAGGDVVTHASEARGALEIEFQDGRVAARAGGVTGAAAGKTGKKPEQGSLF